MTNDGAGMPPRRNAGFTWIEAIVCLVVVVILAMVVLPILTHTGSNKGVMSQSLSNMKRLHLATTQMALDFSTIGETNLGWPGDMGGSYSHWASQIVPSYLSTNDFCKLMSGPGKVVTEYYWPSLGPFRIRKSTLPAMDGTAFRVYAVKENSSETTVFLTTANFTNTPTGGERPNKKAKPYGDKGFVVFRKGGDGAILLPKETGLAYTNVIGAYVPLCR